MPEDRLDDLIADTIDRIEGEPGILKHHRDHTSTKAKPRDIASTSRPSTAMVPPMRAEAGQQADQGAEGDALAGAGLAEQREGLALGEGDVDHPPRARTRLGRRNRP